MGRGVEIKLTKQDKQLIGKAKEIIVGSSALTHCFF